VRPFHDLRHTAITNDAAAGANPVALMTKAGHSDMKTTRNYMHMAGVVFRDEADRLEQRLLGVTSNKQDA
jgi:integrase